jgi:hypothetical protein
VEGIHSKGAEARLVRGEGPPLFKKVKKVNEQPTVALSLGRGGYASTPSFARGAAETQAGNQSSRGVGAEGGSPGSGDCLSKTVMESPGRLVPENPTFRDESRNFGQKRDMIRGVPSDRS